MIRGSQTLQIVAEGCHLVIVLAIIGAVTVLDALGDVARNDPTVLFAVLIGYVAGRRGPAPPPPAEPVSSPPDQRCQS